MCIDGFCQAPPEAMDASQIDAGPPGDAAPPAPLVGGDLLFYSFDDAVATGVVHDRSGNGFDAQLRGAIADTGRFGSAFVYEDNDPDLIHIPGNPALFNGSVITIEAWIFHDDTAEDDVIYGDYDQNQTNATEYTLWIDTDDILNFTTSAGCEVAPETVSGTTAATIAEAAWVHVAVTWDGELVRFYLDGEEVHATEHVVVPCESPPRRPYQIGGRVNGGDYFQGIVDELKVSSVAKSARDIQASMLYDSANPLGVCGDRLVEGEELCDSQTPCCDSCAAAAEGSTCGDGNMCGSTGVCLTGAGRVTDGLVAIYEFDEGGGTVVGDSSGVEPLLDLNIDLLDNVVWNADSLSVNGAVQIVSGAGAQKIYDAALASGALTIEAWIAPANATQGGPARIVSMSANTTQRNFTFGQEDGFYVTRYRTQGSDGQGRPVLDSPPEVLQAEALQHVVFVQNMGGKRFLYVDGVRRSQSWIGGDLSNWSADYPLTVANEVGGARLWLGELHRVAIYGRGLGALEVQRNFEAGAN